MCKAFGLVLDLDVAKTRCLCSVTRLRSNTGRGPTTNLHGPTSAVMLDVCQHVWKRFQRRTVLSQRKTARGIPLQLMVVHGWKPTFDKKVINQNLNEQHPTKISRVTPSPPSLTLPSFAPPCSATSPLSAVCQVACTEGGHARQLRGGSGPDGLRQEAQPGGSNAWTVRRSHIYIYISGTEGGLEDDCPTPSLLQT